MRENETKNFWLQLVNDFYDSDRMMYLESRPHGQEYCLFYTKLLLKSVRTGGMLRLSEKLAYTDEMIAGFTRVSVDVVREAMGLLADLDLVEIWEDGTIFLPEVEDMVGSESKWASYKRKAKSKDKIGDESEIFQDESNSELEIFQSNSKKVEEEIGNFPINKRKENNNKTNNSKEEERKAPAPGARTRSPSSVKGEVKKKYGNYAWVELSDAEHAQLLNELGEAELARCISYIDESAQSTGNRNHWQDWALILRRCSRESWGVKQEKTLQASPDRRTLGYHPPEGDKGECSDEEKRAAAEELISLRQYLDRLKGADTA